MTTIQDTKIAIYKPFIKRVGGKRQLLSQLEKHYPDFDPKKNTYFEPFVGGGAVFFDMRNKFGNAFPAYLMDINDEMIITYNIIKDNVEGLIKELGNEEKYKYDKGIFMHIRALDRDPGLEKLSDIERAARFIYLNRTGFNGMYRVNGQGFYNIPIGRYDNPTICDVDNLREASKALKNTIIKKEDFGNIVNYAKPGDFVYFDPPYDVLTKTANFTGYNKGGFGEDEQIRLTEVYKKLAKKGCKIMLSNHNTERIQGLYSDYKEYSQLVSAKRMINSDASKRGSVEEIVVLNYKN